MLIAFAASKLLPIFGSELLQQLECLRSLMESATIRLFR
ncbi:hypothetical protein O166_23335 [Pseudogulbenkiania ferrooxidans EGD-HP2]|uniref:Uncharacterized protein n=1 Tax=Pseudogulbenkiania ferrooxidans EGD-HP2 TaxID=1388764 RepID=A0ABP2XP83_9NEIS|nr:hypothetical protein O166_23335 [Pseudogulbenkiania ferrooxidans EGD-HP2]